MDIRLHLLRTFYLNGNRNIWLTIWQKLPFGTIVSIPWPGLEDPNKIWRPWLEQNVGRQQRYWEWWLHSDIHTIKIRFLKKTHATDFNLRFG